MHAHAFEMIQEAKIIFSLPLSTQSGRFYFAGMELSFVSGQLSDGLTIRCPAEVVERRDSVEFPAYKRFYNYDAYFKHMVTQLFAFHGVNKAGWQAVMLLLDRSEACALNVRMPDQEDMEKF